MKIKLFTILFILASFSCFARGGYKVHGYSYSIHVHVRTSKNLRKATTPPTHYKNTIAKQNTFHSSTPVAN